MKLRHLFLSLLAGAALLTACQDDEKDLGLPEITISQRDMDLGPEMTTKTLTVNGSRDWTVSTPADWISVNPSKGKAYKETQVVVTILENKTYNRSSTVKFDIGYDSKTLVVTQQGELGEKSTGSGTVEDPFTMDGIFAFIETLGTAESEDIVFVTGKVTTITEAYTTQFGNATFTITEDGKGNSEAFTCYRVKYLGNKSFSANDTPIKEGDEVIVAGKVVNYNGKTKETVNGTGYLYSLNGENRGTGGGAATGDAVYANDFDKTKATQTFGSGNAWPYMDQFDGWQNQKGSGVENVEYTYEAMSVRANSESSGNYSDYEGSGSNNLFFGTNSHFCVKNIALGDKKDFTLSFGTERYVVGATDNTFVHSEFHVYVSNDNEKWVELQYAFPNGDKSGRWDKASTTFSVPDGVSQLSIYIKVDVGSAYRLDDLRLDPSTDPGTVIDFSTGIDLGTGGGGGGGNEDQPSGTGTLEDPYNPAGAAAAVANLTWTSTTEYQTTSEVYVKGKICKIANNGTFTGGGTYGNASFYITESGSESGTQFQAYRILYLGNKKFETGQTDIKVGDEVIIYGKLMNYKGNTPETVSGAYLYSLNGKTSDDGSGSGGGGGDDTGEQASGTGTLADPYNPAGAAAAVANLTWTSTTEYQTTSEVYVKGKICKIANNGTFTGGGTYGNASFYISQTGEQTGTQFYCFRILYLGNKKFETGQTDIKVGDEVIVLGKLMNYQGNTPETVAGSAYLYSLNGSTSDDGSGSGGGDTGGGSTSYTFKKVSNVTAGKAYLIYASGKIAKPIESTKTYGYLNVVDATVSTEGNDQVITLSSVDNAFLVEAMTGATGYTIKQVADGRYLYMTGTYNSFNVNASPTEGQYWSVSVEPAAGSLHITNMSNSKFFQYSSNYTSFGCYAEAQNGGVYPELFELQGELPQ